MKKNLYNIILNPVVTEKGTRLEAKKNKYFFKVHPQANKKEIKIAVEKIFQVKVADVNTLWMRGKMKRVRFRPGLTPSWKKAIVTLKPGNKIDFT